MHTLVAVELHLLLFRKQVFYLFLTSPSVENIFSFLCAPDSSEHLVRPFFRMVYVTPVSKGRAGCITYVCQDLFPHIC
jgi:hypothetical protein